MKHVSPSLLFQSLAVIISVSPWNFFDGAARVGVETGRTTDSDEDQATVRLRSWAPTFSLRSQIECLPLVLGWRGAAHRGPGWTAQDRSEN